MSKPSEAKTLKTNEEKKSVKTQQKDEKLLEDFEK